MYLVIITMTAQIERFILFLHEMLHMNLYLLYYDLKAEHTTLNLFMNQFSFTLNYFAFASVVPKFFFAERYLIRVNYLVITREEVIKRPRPLRRRTDN